MRGKLGSKQEEDMQQRVTGQNRTWVFLMRPQDNSNCVCCDQKRYFKLKCDLFLTPIKCFFLSTPFMLETGLSLEILFG